MTHKTTLIAALRNEGPFLLEWIAYHRVIGFTDIVLFHDAGVDGSADLLAALAAGGAVTAHANPGSGGHRNRAYARAWDLPVVAQADRVMALDTDEFLNIHAGEGHLSDLMAVTPEADLISLTWRLFGHSGIARFADLPVLDRFVQAAPPDAAVSDRQFGLKTLFRPGVASGIGPHRPVIRAGLAADDIRWVDGAGADVTTALIQSGWKATADAPGYGHAQINHYVVRSAEIFALHNLATPPLGSEPTPLTLADYTSQNLNHATDQSITRHAPAVRAEMDRLGALPGVAAAHAACVAATEDLIARMRQAHALIPDGPVAQVCDPQAAKRLLHDQQARHARAATVGRAAPAAPRTTVIETVDVAPRWLADLRRSDHRAGWYLSDETFAVQFTQRSSDVLVVSFDNLSTVADASLARDTWGYGFYAAEGWSHMGIMAFEKNWYRDEILFDLMESQRDLFARYRRVVLTGTSMGAYAATAFADLAPGCTVLAFSPQATLDPDRVPWEDRFGGGRRRDWSGRYGFAPDHCGRAGAVFVVYDPYFAPDRRHADLYDGDNVHRLKCWYANHKSAKYLRQADILKPLMQAAVAGDLTEAAFYRLFRARRDLVWYYTGLADAALARGHVGLAARLADHLDGLDKTGLATSIRSRLQGTGDVTVP